MLAPMTPPLCATALMISSVLLRSRLASARAFACVTQNRLRRDLNRTEHSTLPDMREIDGDTELVHHPNGIATEARETCLLRLEAAVAKSVPEVIGELHDPKPEPPEEIEAIEFVGDGSHVL